MVRVFVNKYFKQRSGVVCFVVLTSVATVKSFCKYGHSDKIASKIDQRTCIRSIELFAGCAE